MRGGNKWLGGQHSVCAESTNGSEANTQNARGPTLRMRGGNKWLGGQHSECAEATNGSEANTQNARRPTLILHHAKQAYLRHGNPLQPRALADVVDGELLLNLSSRVRLQHCLFLLKRADEPIGRRSTPFWASFLLSFITFQPFTERTNRKRQSSLFFRTRFNFHVRVSLRWLCRCDTGQNMAAQFYMNRVFCL